MSALRSDRNLKMLGKILFDQIGYVSYWEVKLRTKSYIKLLKNHDVSDIDVYGCRFLVDMTFISAGAECKSGESKALDELYKFTGIVEYFDLDKGYFIKTKIHQNAREVARKRGISCFSDAELRRLLFGLGVDVDQQLKVELARYGKLSSALNKHRQIDEKLVDYLTFEYWNRDNWKNIHNLIHLVGNQSGGGLFPDTDLEYKLFYYYVLELFALSTLRNIREAMIVGFSDIGQALKVSLYGGAESLSEKQRIYDLVNRELGKDRQFSPGWEDDFLSLSSRFSDHTRDASEVLSLLRDIRENAFYSDGIKLAPAVGARSDITRKFAQDLVQFLTRHSGMDERIFREFMEM